MRTVLVFGTFDGLHPGHDYFFREAAKLGDELVVCLARNSTVEELKGRPPKRSEEARREAVAESEAVDRVIYGDRELGTYQIIDDVAPSVIALGYDQTALAGDLKRWFAEHQKTIEIITIPAFEPDRYKSSLL